MVCEYERIYAVHANDRRSCCPDETPPAGSRFEIVFEASGCVGKGDGPDALDVPEQENDQ